MQGLRLQATQVDHGLWKYHHSCNASEVRSEASEAPLRMWYDTAFVVGRLVCWEFKNKISISLILIDTWHLLISSV